MKFIINGDDLGANAAINKAIRKYAENNLVSSATILANGKNFEGVKGVVRSCPYISCGAHLNLTEFESLTKADIFREVGIINSNGSFMGNLKTKKIAYTNFLKEAIYNEWKTQLEKLYDNGIPISHIDGHHHVHTWTVFYNVLKRIQKKFHINKVRIRYRKPFLSYLIKKNNDLTSGNNYWDSNEKSTDNTEDFIVQKYRALRNLIQHEAWLYLLKHNYSTKTVDYFFSYLEICRYLMNGNAIPKDCTIELMTHPGHGLFKEENFLIEEKKLHALIPNFKMITYNDL